jgi:2-haloalkanoic acid dehalogenase type II
MSGMITTIIFDVYETLAHNNPGLWIETFRRICRAQGLEIDHQVLYREWKALEIGFRQERQNLEEPEKSPPFKSYQEAWRDCFSRAFSRLSLEGDAAAAAKDAIRDMGEREPYQDALEALPAIQSRWRTGVLSNADDDYLFPTLARAGWKFEAVLSSEEARAYKPLPSPFRQIMDRLGVGPEEAMYVGDTQYDDVLGAGGVGMRTAWVNRHGASLDPRLPDPDYEIRSLVELTEIAQSAS